MGLALVGMVEDDADLVHGEPPDLGSRAAPHFGEAFLDAGLRQFGNLGAERAPRFEALVLDAWLGNHRVTGNLRDVHAVEGGTGTLPLLRLF